MSEPNAGSDLAGLRTRAVLDGDEFVVNGQKVWTSGAHDADVIFTFVRTDPDAPKHKGISALIIPTDTPGVTRRPFGSITSPDDLDFNEVFFDDVAVPVDEPRRRAEPGLARRHRLARRGAGDALAEPVRTARRRGRELRATRFAARRIADDPLTQDWYGKLLIDAMALRLLGYRTVAESARGKESAQQSILKLLGSEAAQSASLHALEALGPDLVLDRDRRSAPDDPWQFDVFNEGWFSRYVRSFAMTIAGGTSEIQRNIVAERVLGLPR